MINSLFASGSWLCYSLCYCDFRSFLLIIFVDCHVLTIKTTTHCCRLPFRCGIHKDYPDETSGCSHHHAGFVCLIVGFSWCRRGTETKRMFSEWGVTKWVDLACFTVKDVDAFIDVSESTALCPQCLRKQLGFLVEYARLGRDIEPTTSIWSVICVVDAYRSNPLKSHPRPPMSPPRASPHQEKKTIPNLKEIYQQRRRLFFLVGLRSE